MNKLYIDTRDNNEIVVRLISNGKKFEKKSGASKDRAQAALPMIEELLKKAKITPSDISQIDVETGPGSLTGVRVGISIANALSFGALIKINGKELSELAVPEY